MTRLMATLFPTPASPRGAWGPCRLPERYRMAGRGHVHNGHVHNGKVHDGKVHDGSPPSRVPPGSGDQGWLARPRYAA